MPLSTTDPCSTFKVDDLMIEWKILNQTVFNCRLTDVTFEMHSAVINFCLKTATHIKVMRRKSSNRPLLIIHTILPFIRDEANNEKKVFSNRFEHDYVLSEASRWHSGMEIPVHIRKFKWKKPSWKKKKKEYSSEREKNHTPQRYMGDGLDILNNRSCWRFVVVV